ncbi:hypothetical protein J6590_102065 [Homalodisca vitripennis]|nr:hypothetical protein J6590_102065 [Homalodisca vitripennis]
MSVAEPDDPVLLAMARRRRPRIILRTARRGQNGKPVRNADDMVVPEPGQSVRAVAKTGTGYGKEDSQRPPPSSGPQQGI